MEAQRRRAALVVLLAWVWAVVLLPALHGVGHRPDHVHGPDGTTSWLAPEQPRSTWFAGRDDPVEAVVERHSLSDWHRFARKHRAELRATHDERGASKGPLADHRASHPHQHPGPDGPSPGDHGAGSVEHAQALYLGGALVVLPATLTSVIALVELPPLGLVWTPQCKPEVQRCRGPPRPSIGAV